MDTMHSQGGNVLIWRWRCYLQSRQPVLQTWNRVTGSPGYRVIRVTFSHRVTGSPGYQGDPVNDPVLSFFRKMFVLCFSLYSVNNRKSSVNYNRSTGRLVTSSQQHNGFLNNVHIQILFYNHAQIRYSTGPFSLKSATLRSATLQTYVELLNVV